MILQKKINLPQNFSEGFKQLNNVRKEVQNVAESKAKLIASMNGDNYKEIIAKEVSSIITTKPQTVIENIQKITNPILDISSGIVDKMSQSENPLAQEIGAKIEKNEKLNPAKVKNVLNSMLVNSAMKADEFKSSIEKEVIKNVVKEKVEEIIKPKNIWERFKDFCKNIYMKITHIFS